MRVLCVCAYVFPELTGGFLFYFQIIARQIPRISLGLSPGPLLFGPLLSYSGGPRRGPNPGSEYSFLRSHAPLLSGVPGLQLETSFRSMARALSAGLVACSMMIALTSACFLNSCPYRRYGRNVQCAPCGMLSKQ